jgi:hypothetical protein
MAKDYSKSKSQRVLEVLAVFAVVVLVTYAFLSLTNWSFNLKDWTGFSRFILGAEGVIFLIKMLDA